MNTEGLNLGLSPRGAAELRASGRDQKMDLKKTNGSSESDSFAKVMSSKSQDTRKDAAPENKTQSVNEPKKREAKEEAGAPVQKKGSGAREKVMLEFMDSMESEFGIPPERILEAMADLPKDKMLLSPEETAAQVIDALELPPEQEERAYSLYAGMLNQLNQLPTIPAPKPELLTAVSPSVIQQNALMAKARQEQLGSSIDRLNQKFFMNDKSAVAGEAGLMNSAHQPMETSQLVDKLSFERAQGNALTPQDLRSYQNGRPELKSPPQPGLENGQVEPKSDDPMATLMAKLSAVGASAAAVQQAVAKTPNGSPVVQAEQAPSSNEGGPAGGGTGGLGLMSLGGLAGGSGAAAQSGLPADTSDEESQGSDQSTKSGSLEQIGRGLEGHQAEKGLGFQETLQMASPGLSAHGTNQADREANIEKLMNQAQIVARKGGGEATIRMSPEGLGDVQLRVIVKDGKVNVEMATETKEAKKMIESSLSDLKMGLAGHKLSVDSIKVDTGLQTSSDSLNQQRQQDLSQNQNQGRDQARQFFQNFRDENLSRREPFFETAGARAYSRPVKTPDPLSGPSSTEAKARRVAEGRGERMNLVA